MWDCKDNARFIVTSMSGETYPGRVLYEDFCCHRGDAENRLLKLKCNLFAMRCSSNLFNANTLRLHLSAFAHIAFIVLRRSLNDTAWLGLQPGTLRLKLLEIGACVTRSIRRINVALSSAYPNQNMFMHVWWRWHPPNDPQFPGLNSTPAQRQRSSKDIAGFGAYAFRQKVLPCIFGFEN